MELRCPSTTHRLSDYKLQREKNKTRSNFTSTTGAWEHQQKKDPGGASRSWNSLKLDATDPKREKKNRSHYRGRKNRETTSIAFFRHHSILKTYFEKDKQAGRGIQTFNYRRAVTPPTPPKKNKKTKSLPSPVLFGFFSQLEKCRHPSPHRHR